jgi:hypothetical protein
VARTARSSDAIDSLNVSLILFSCDGGDLLLPARRLLLVSRLDGGNLVVNPPRRVWERSALTPLELTRWSALVAAAGRAMLETLPQLEAGCINYWEAGNWALNELAEPRGPKTPREHRNVHLHLLGRSRSATHPSWQWGESPVFPRYADRDAWASGFERLTADECRAVVARTETLLTEVYGFARDAMRPWSPCATCGYPMSATAEGRL